LQHCQQLAGTVVIGCGAEDHDIRAPAADGHVGAFVVLDEIEPESPVSQQGADFGKGVRPGADDESKWCRCAGGFGL